MKSGFQGLWQKWREWSPALTEGLEAAGTLGSRRETRWNLGLSSMPLKLLPRLSPAIPTLCSLVVLFSRSVMSDSFQPHGLQHARLPYPISWSLRNLKAIESVMSSDHLILWCPLLLLPSIFPSIRVFSNELAHCIRGLKYWHFSFSISSSNEYSGLISFRTDQFDLPAVQRTLKSLLQHHNLKASILQRSFSLWSSAHICTWLLEKPQLWLCKLTYSQIWMNHVNQKFQS